VALPGSTGDPWQQAILAAKQIAAARLHVLVLDTDTSFVRLGRVQELAQALGAQCLPLENLSSETLLLSIRRHQTSGEGP
jgi:magnesium chelatase subunit D